MNESTINATAALVFANGKLQTIEGLTSGQEEQGLVQTKKLPAGTVIQAHTRNSVYTMTLDDPDAGVITIQGGSRFADPTRATLNGSTWGGSMLMLGAIGIGMHLEIGRADNFPLVTTAVDRIVVTREAHR